MKKVIDSKGIIAVLLLNFTALKMMFLPSLCCAELEKNGFISVIFMMLLEVGVVAILLWLAKKSGKSFFETLEELLGKVLAKIIIAIYLIYFLINTFGIIQSFYQFLTENLYASLPWLEFILPLFIMLFLVCSTSLQSLTRLVQCFIPFLVICIFISLFLGALNCDYSNILPFFEKGYRNGVKIFDFSYWFGDAIILVLFFGKIDKNQKSSPIIWSTVVASVVVAFFFLVFYCIYESNALNNKEAIVDILKVLPQNSDIGSITWVITILWEVMLLLYICTQVFASRVFLENLFGFKNHFWSIAICLGLILAGVLITNFNMSQVLALLIKYAKYLALGVQYALPIIYLLAGLKYRRRNEKVISK